MTNNKPKSTFGYKTIPFDCGVKKILFSLLILIRKLSK